MERRLCREREMACDEGVVRRTQAPRAYAACLTTLAERGLQQRELLRRAHALSLGAFTRRPELVHRVHSILRRKRALNPLAAARTGRRRGIWFGRWARWNFRAARSWWRSWRRQADAQVAALDPQSGPEGIRATDAVFRSSVHFRAIETKAITPASRNNAMAAVAVRPRRGDEPSAGMTDVAKTNAGSAAHAQCR